MGQTNSPAYSSLIACNDLLTTHRPICAFCPSNTVSAGQMNIQKADIWFFLIEVF
jgi:hypothetical protein